MQIETSKCRGVEVPDVSDFCMSTKQARALQGRVKGIRDDPRVGTRSEFGIFRWVLPKLICDSLSAVKGMCTKALSRQKRIHGL